MTAAYRDLRDAGFDDETACAAVDELIALSSALCTWRWALERRLGHRLTSYQALSDRHFEIVGEAAASWKMPNALRPL